MRSDDIPTRHHKHTESAKYSETRRTTLSTRLYSFNSPYLESRRHFTQPFVSVCATRLTYFIMYTDTNTPTIWGVRRRVVYQNAQTNGRSASSRAPGFGCCCCCCSTQNKQSYRSPAQPSIWCDTSPMEDV